MRIGLTGTIGSGKSLVADELARLGAAVIDTDELARRVVAPGTPGLERIIARWGGGVLEPDGTLDRKRLADVVFHDENQRRELNAILHPLIQAETARELQRFGPDRTVVIVVPLLFESGFEAIVDRVWVVAADENILVGRIVARDGMTGKQARARISAQMPQEDKLRRADVVVRNDGSIDDTRRQVVEAWNSIAKP